MQDLEWYNDAAAEEKKKNVCGVNMLLYSFRHLN